MEKIFIFFLSVNFVPLIQCQSCNDALVWTGGTKKFGAIGIICNSSLIHDDENLAQNLTSPLISMKQVNLTSGYYWSIVYDARTKFVAVSDDYQKALKIFYLPDILKESSGLKTYYTFDLSPMALVTGLAFATNFHLLYWVDALFKYIGVVDFETSRWTKIVNSDLETPFSIVIHEEKKLLFWNDLGSRPKIERSNLYGEGRSTIVDSFLFKPLSLVLDKYTERLFWVDSAALNSCDLEGEKVITYTSDVDAITPFVVDKDAVIFGNISGDFKYFEISENDDLVIRNPNNSSFHFANTTYILSMFLDSDEFIKDLPNPCKNSCDHLSFPRSDKKCICRCLIGYSLGPDGRTCNKGNLGKAQLLVRDYRGVTYQVDPNNGQANTILNVQPSNLKNITYLEFSTFQYIYYTKEDARTIMRYNVSSGNSSFYYNLTTDITDMIADQTTGDLYVSNDGGVILRITFEGKNTIFVDTKEGEIKKLYIHPETRRFFYSDCDSETVKEVEIEAGTTNKTYEVDICVNSMAFDLESEYAYYAEHKNIWRQELNELSMNKIFTSKDKIKDFVMEGDFLYIVQFSHNVVKLDKNTMQETQLTGPIFRNAAQIMFLSKSNVLHWQSFGSSCLMASLLLVSTHFQSFFY